MKTLLLAIFIFIFSVGKSNAQNWNWVSTDGSAQAESAKCIALDVDHKSIVVGTFSGSIFSGANTLISNGGVDIFLAKYDSIGNLLWAKSGGGVGNDGDYNMGVAIDDSGNINVACRTTGDVIFEQDTLIGNFDNMTLLKYDSNGNKIFAKIYGGYSYDAASDIDIDKIGNIYVTGGFHTELNFGSVILTGLDHGDIYIAKFDPMGNIIWAHSAGGYSYDNSGGVAADIFGNVYITGYFSNSVMFDSIPLVSTSGTAAFIAKYDSTGDIQWVNRIDGIGLYESGSRIGVDENGFIYTMGAFSDSVVIGSNTYTSRGGTDIYLAKLDPYGNYVWVKNFGGNGDDAGYDISVIDQGSHYITGSFSTTAYFDTDSLISSGGVDIFILLLDGNGNIQWAKQTGGVGDDIGWGIDAESISECYVSGSFSDTVTFDNLTQNSTGLSDLFVGKIASHTNGIFTLNTSSTLNVFPNPVKADGVLTLHFDQAKLSGDYFIYDSKGNLIKTEKVRSAIADQKIKLPHNLTPGIYFIQLLCEDGKSRSCRFIVAE